MTSAPRSSKVGEKCALVALAAMLIHRGLAVAQEPVRLLTQPQAEVVEMGPHHRVWSRAELVPDGRDFEAVEDLTALGRRGWWGWDTGPSGSLQVTAADSGGGDLTV